MINTAHKFNPGWENEAYDAGKAIFNHWSYAFSQDAKDGSNGIEYWCSIFTWDFKKINTPNPQW